MKVKYINPIQKDITDEMLDDYKYFYDDNNNKIYDLGFIIDGKKIYKAYYKETN